MRLGWEPIGNRLDEFTGVYNGKGYKILNLKINNPNLNYAGLFANIQNAQLKNINLVNVNVLGNDFVGSLAGQIEFSEVRNCRSSGTVSGDSAVGGLIGIAYNRLAIANCRSSVKVYGGWSSGGLVGSSSGSIINSFASGTVRVDNSQLYGSAYVGGLCGFHRGNITNCWASGDVFGYYILGGLVGHYSSGSITRSYATGDVISYADKYTDHATSYGGLVGDNYSGTILDCFATGNIGNSYTDTVGGLVGHNNRDSPGNNGIIQNCYATGRVTGKNPIGGLVGRNNIRGQIVNSYYDLETTGRSDTGKGIPKTTREMQSGIPSTPIYNNWSTTVWGFTPANQYPYLLIFASPPRVTLKSPANNATIAGTAITLRWNAARGATKYQVQIRRANGTVFKNRTLSNVLQLRQAGFPDNGSSFKWRVRAGNAAGWGPWSVFRNLKNGR